MSAVLFGERITASKIVALVITFTGCALVVGLIPFGQQSLSGVALLYGFGSAFGYALYSIFGKFALAKYSPSTVTFYTFLFTAAFSLPISGLYRDIRLLFCDWRAIVGALGISLLCNLLSNLLYTKGLQHIEAGKAAIISTIEPLVATAIGIGLYHEDCTPYKMLGMVAILFAILLLNFPVKIKSK